MFSLNSLNSVTKIIVSTLKGSKPATSYVEDQDATIVPARQGDQQSLLHENF